MNTVVYQHLKPNNEVFYIGIGSKKRPKSKSDRSNYWHNIVNKYGYKIEILHENLNWELACEIEIHLISYYGRKDLGLGSLCNLTDGGDGSIGVLRSKESIEKQKITYYNRTLKEKLETSLKISKALKNRIISQETKDKLSKVKRGNKNCLGRVYTEAQKTQLSISNKGKKHIHTEIGLQNVKKNQYKKGHSIHNKKVININTGEIFKSAKICHLKENLKISAGHLRDMMSGLKRNNTIYEYYENYMEKNKKQLVAVYGSLRSDMSNHHLLSTSEYLGDFKTKPEFSLYSLGFYPGLKTDGNTSVTMEVYEIDEKTADRVDRLESYTPGGNNTFYDKIPIETPYGEASVYIYVDDIPKERIVKSGDWKAFKQSYFSPTMN